MPRYFLVIRFPQEEHGKLSPNIIEDSNPFPERESYTFYETDSQDVAEKILGFFQKKNEHNKPSEAYEMVAEADLEYDKLDDLEYPLSILEFILNTRSDNPEVWGKKGLPNDSKAQLLLAKYRQAQELEHSIRKKMGARAKGKRRGGRKRTFSEDKIRPLTEKQTEAVHIVGECKGNLAEAARQIGISYKSLKQRYEAANKKLGVRAVNRLPKAQTKCLPTDRRGQEHFAENDDARER